MWMNSPVSYVYRRRPRVRSRYRVSARDTYIFGCTHPSIHARSNSDRQQGRHIAIPTDMHTPRHATQYTRASRTRREQSGPDQPCPAHDRPDKKMPYTHTEVARRIPTRMHTDRRPCRQTDNQDLFLQGMVAGRHAGRHAACQAYMYTHIHTGWSTTRQPYSQTVGQTGTQADRQAVQTSEADGPAHAIPYQARLVHTGLANTMSFRQVRRLADRPAYILADLQTCTRPDRQSGGPAGWRYYDAAMQQANATG